MFGPVTKFIVAALGAILVILNVLLPFFHGQAQDIFTAVVSGVTALMVYLSPNTPRTVVSAVPPGGKTAP